MSGSTDSGDGPRRTGTGTETDPEAIETEDEIETVEQLERRIDEKFRETYTASLRSQGVFELIIYAFAIGFFVYHMWYAYTIGLSRDNHGVIHLALILSLWGLLQLLKTDREVLRGKLASVGYALYSVLAVVPLYYMHTFYGEIVLRTGAYTDLDFLMGVALIVLIFIPLWIISRLIAAVAASGIVYALFGPYMPGFLAHGGLSVERVVTMNTLEMEGLLGTLLQVSATWVVIFLLLAGLMETYGGMAQFIKGASRYASQNPYLEIGQIAIAASMVMGSINGSTAANTATTGAFTIPLMKENGYKPKLAAAIESVASCGGQVLPPIMGAGAFLMAELIEPAYSDIIVAATAPALLFFLTTSASVTLNSRDTTTRSLRSERDPLSIGERTIGVLRHYEYIGMFVMLLYWLVYIQADPMLAGFYSILTLIALRLVRTLNEIRTDDVETSSTLLYYGRETLEGFRRGAEVTVNITILLASLGIVIRALTVTGFAQRLSTQLVIISGGVLLILLVLAMIASIAFGMGMSTAAAYMIVGILIAPSLTTIGLNELPAHLFVFYFAIVANITPPIALSVIIAQGIAGSGFWETAIESLKIGFPMFLLPYAFLFNQSLLYPSLMTIPVFAIVLVAFVAMSIALSGNIREKISLPARAGFLVVGFTALFVPHLIAQIGFAALCVGLVVYLGFPSRAASLNPISR
ncbi:TRAP transporter fused permease subunit [Halalkalicoccus tibetensis]|uniref:TRAP transporter permease n=1 Tax=Halalkalicoccus tibetensis TaxID=175632 RepID=A0ABD5V616_9EURY